VKESLAPRAAGVGGGGGGGGSTFHNVCEWSAVLDSWSAWLRRRITDGLLAGEFAIKARQAYPKGLNGSHWVLVVHGEHVLGHATCDVCSQQFIRNVSICSVSRFQLGGGQRSTETRHHFYGPATASERANQLRF
jgi:hypothetical protein